MTIGGQPVSAGLIWLATLVGGALAGYIIAIWNGRVLRSHSPLTTAAYVVIGAGGWVVTLLILANFTPPQSGEPGFGIPVALGLGFLLVSIPYNRDTLTVNQWMWNHPGRKLVVNIGPSIRFGYTSFAKAQGELFGGQADAGRLVSIPVVPVVVLILGLAIGVGTVALGDALAPK
jgi:hypothetical protein